MTSKKEEDRLFSQLNEIELNIFAKKDHLTGVFLRDSFEPYLKNLIKESKEKNKTFSIVFMDLDHFKKINDKHGHLLGDEVLKYVTSSLRLSFEETSCKIFRYGGDEFILLFPNKTSQETKKIIQLLKYTMQRRPVLFKTKFFRITSSYGIANYPTDGTSSEELIKKSDNALYFSKHQGRNYITLSNEIKSRKFINASRLLLKIFFCLWIIWAVRPEIINAFTLTKITIHQIKEESQEKNKDKIVLINGTVALGIITDETHQTLTITYDTDDGPIAMFVRKSEISSKSYGKKTLSQKHFKEYTRNGPNPHDK